MTWTTTPGGTHSGTARARTFVEAGVFAALMVLTALTVGVADVDLGLLNLPIALAIAVGKALLVILFFMHVKYSAKLVQVTPFTGFLFLGILVVLTMAGYLGRGMLGVH